MPTTVLQILSGAYNRSSRNDPGKLALDPELIAHLNRVYQRAWPLVARARPDEFQSEAPVTMSGSPASGAIPADTIALNGCYTAAAFGYPQGQVVTITPSTDRTRLWNLAPVVWRSGNAIVSRGQVGDPLAGDVLTVLVLDAPAPLTTTSQTIDLRWPIRQVQLLIDYLALYLSTKDAGRDAEEHEKILGEYKDDLAAFQAEFGLAPADISWMHDPVERAGA